jgi:hypothetical protein
LLDQVRKQALFFEKKKQKTFNPWRLDSLNRHRAGEDSRSVME